ncbi:MAG: hypothetical protein ACLQUW_13055 [Desulfobaccales bacterium]
MTGPKESIYFNEAERLFVMENRTPEQIAEILPICQNTIYKWSLKGGWPKKREASLASPRSLAEKLRRYLERQIEALEGESRLNPAAYDAIHKTYCTIEKLEREVQDLRPQAIVAMNGFVSWLNDQPLSADERRHIATLIRGWFRSLE